MKQTTKTFQFDGWFLFNIRITFTNFAVRAVKALKICDSVVKEHVVGKNPDIVASQIKNLQR